MIAETECKASVLVPNDLNPSDGGGWRDGCASVRGGATSVTVGAVCGSAWLNEAASRESLESGAWVIGGVGGDGDRGRIWGVGLGKILVRYPVRYVQKTAISEQLLLGDDEAGNIRLNCQNSRTWRWQMITLSVAEFLRR